MEGQTELTDLYTVGVFGCSLKGLEEYLPYPRNLVILPVQLIDRALFSQVTAQYALRIGDTSLVVVLKVQLFSSKCCWLRKPSQKKDEDRNVVLLSENKGVLDASEKCVPGLHV